MIIYIDSCNDDFENDIKGNVNYDKYLTFNVYFIICMIIDVIYMYILVIWLVWFKTHLFIQIQ